MKSFELIWIEFDMKNWVETQFKLHAMSFNIFIQMELNFQKKKSSFPP
jgi:hypothetical protein